MATPPQLGMRTAFSIRERSKAMKTKTNVKAGTIVYQRK